MADLKVKQRERKQHDRAKRSSASVSVSWSVYDKLDALAGNNRGSIGAVIEGLLVLYEQVKGAADNDDKSSRT